MASAVMAGYVKSLLDQDAVTPIGTSGNIYRVGLWPQTSAPTDAVLADDTVLTFAQFKTATSFTPTDSTHWSNNGTNPLNAAIHATAAYTVDGDDLTLPSVSGSGNYDIVIVASTTTASGIPADTDHVVCYIDMGGSPVTPAGSVDINIAFDANGIYRLGLQDANGWFAGYLETLMVTPASAPSLFDDTIQVLLYPSGNAPSAAQIADAAHTTLGDLNTLTGGSVDASHYGTISGTFSYSDGADFKVNFPASTLQILSAADVGTTFDLLFIQNLTGDDAPVSGDLLVGYANLSTPVNPTGEDVTITWGGTGSDEMGRLGGLA